MVEEWRAVVGYESRYEVSNWGRVKSLAGNHATETGIRRKAKDRILAGWQEFGSRPSVQLCAGTKSNRKRRMVHQLVAEAFIGPRPDGHVCCHNNGKPWDNRAVNLRWGTVSENAMDRVKHGTAPRGEANASAILTWEKVREARRLNAEYGVPCNSLARLLGITRITMQRILQGKSWIEGV